MSTIVTVQTTDLITNSRADLNTNFSNLNTDKFEASNVDTDTALAANSDSKVASQKAVKAYVDAGGNVNASETARGIVEEATDAEVTAGTATGGTGAKLFITPAKLTTRLGSFGKFGGDGTDGALSITSGTTTIDLGNAAVVVKQYTSISITGTGVLAFSNPNTAGSVVVLKSQGAVTLTSSATPMAGSVGIGAAGASSATGGSDGSDGTDGVLGFFLANKATGGTAGSGGTKGNAISFSYPTSPVLNEIISIYPHAFIGAGGGSGKSGGGSSGAGGNGAGVLIIECGGALNFTTTNGLSAKGAAGSNAASGGGGGGGGGGFVAILYNTLTANTGTIAVSASSGGTGTSAGGGGGGGGLGAGTNGTVSAGGSGGLGISFVAKNTELA